MTAGGLPGQVSSVLHEIKVISCSSTRYRPTWQKRAVDVRAGQLQQEYIAKARAADRRDGRQAGEVGRVEQKLVSLGPIRGIVAGNFGEVSEDTHLLLDALATCRVRTSGPSLGRRGYMRSEEGERAVAIAALRRRLGVMTVRCQASSLLGRMETLGPGGAAAAGRRQYATDVAARWRREARAFEHATREGWRALRTGFAKFS